MTESFYLPQSGYYFVNKDNNEIHLNIISEVSAEIDFSTLLGTINIKTPKEVISISDWDFKKSASEYIYESREDFDNNSRAPLTEFDITTVIRNVTGYYIGNDGIIHSVDKSKLTFKFKKDPNSCRFFDVVPVNFDYTIYPSANEASLHREYIEQKLNGEEKTHTSIAKLVEMNNLQKEALEYLAFAIEECKENNISLCIDREEYYLYAINNKNVVLSDTEENSQINVDSLLTKLRVNIPIKETDEHYYFNLQNKNN